MTQTLSREQIEWSRKILAALTEDAVMKPGGTFGLKQPEWKNRVDLIIDMALASLDGAELIRAAAMEEAARGAEKNAVKQGVLREKFPPDGKSWTAFDAAEIAALKEKVKRQAEALKPFAVVGAYCLDDRVMTESTWLRLGMRTKFIEAQGFLTHGNFLRAAQEASE